MTAFGDLIIDFATRTLVNLDLVKDAAKETDNEAYEVTQLWNSLLGLVVAPREQDIEVFPRTKLSYLRASGWPDITTAGRLPSDDLWGLVSALRNAVAHFNVEFHANGKGEIEQVSLWNVATDEWDRPVPGAPHRWRGRLDVQNLEDLARKIAATYTENRDIWSAAQ